MKIDINEGHRYNIKFNYIPGSSCPREITVCSIHDLVADRFYESYVKKHPKDKDDKKIARTLALGKAIQLVTNDKQLRSYIWNEYNKNTKDLPNVVIK